jgi:DNA topoisomerase-1
MAAPKTPARTEHEEAAERAGLRYVSDRDPGIRREAVDGGFAYVGANGRSISSERTLERIRGLAIPPAWADVWICPDAGGHLQATGRDAKGRKQYRYHPKYRSIRDETKFDHMEAFSRVLPRVRSRVESDCRRPGLPREKVLATVVWLLERTLIRVGNVEYARDNESFGLTTMQGRHAEVRGSEVLFTFRGKSGREHSVSVRDRRLARIVQRSQTLPGEELFQYLDENGEQRDIGSQDVNGYLRAIGPRITAKDFRTWSGTMIAAGVLREMGPVRLVKEREKNVVTAVERASERLGNTRAVCRRYYVHPVVIEGYLRGRVLPPQKPAKRAHDRRSGGGTGLRKHERDVMRFIREERG